MLIVWIIFQWVQENLLAIVIHYSRTNIPDQSGVTFWMYIFSSKVLREKLIAGHFAGFAPIGTFVIQYLYDRPILTAITLLRAQLPFANLIPTATIGFLIEIGVIKEKWIGGEKGPFKQI